MATFTVDVAVSDFFVAGVTHVDHLDLEGQALAGQRVVAVNSDVVTIDVTDGDDLHLAIRRRSVELHADFQLVDAFEQAAVQGADQLGQVFAVGIFRLDGNVQFVTGLLAFQGFSRPGIMLPAPCR